MTAFGARDSFYAQSSVGDLIERFRCEASVAITNLMQIDSCDMRDHHRDAIAAEITSSPERCIVVTHGTDTVAQTADYLAARSPDRTIILTGSFSPALEPKSDAPCNLASAITASRLLPAGVYLAAQCEIFCAGAFRKNKAELRFERI